MRPLGNALLCLSIVMPPVCTKTCSQVTQPSLSNSNPQSSKGRHVKASNLAARQVIHVTMPDTSQCHVNNTAQDKQDDTNKANSEVSTAVSLPTRCPSSEGSASSGTRNDPGSPVAYQLVEQVYFALSCSVCDVEGRIWYLSFSWQWSAWTVLLSLSGTMDPSPRLSNTF